MERFARAAAAIAARSGKLEKVAVLADYLRELGDADLVAATRFFTGRAFAARDSRTLSIGGRSIVKVARALWNFDDAALGEAYRSTGDLGSALAQLVGPPAAPMLLPEPPLTPARLDDLFGEIGDAVGKNAAKRRESALEQILRACREPAVAAYVVKIVTGDLRLGLREGLVLDAIAHAFAAEPAAVRRAVMASGDVGAAALAARNQRLDDVRVEYGTPIGFMLASPIAYGQTYADLDGGGWIVEDKYDGIRAQAHVRGATVQLFSRRLNEVSASYPDVVGALAGLPRAAILDGEIVAMRDGRVLPFRHLQARLRRKRLDAALLEEVPLAYVAFDLLAIGDDLLLDEPYARRRALLTDLIEPRAGLALAPFDRPDDAGAAVNARFEQARARGNEGLMLKREDSPYSPGRRGKWWLKLKRELSTLDVVVVAVEWGHGKRAKVLSDYTFAVRESAHSPRLLAIGKAYSGLTDAEIAKLTSWFLEHRLHASERRIKARHGEIPVEPQIVLEVAFDIIQESDLHESSFSLRFPRIVRIRDDKPAGEIDTIDRVREIYDEMLRREGLS